MANFSATKGRVFKQCATKGTEHQMCAKEGMVFALVVPGRVQNVKNCIKLAEFSVLRANNCANEPFLNTKCATESTLFCGFVPVRVWICAQSLCQ